MATRSGEYKYAQVINEQYNPNYDGDKSRWSNMANASGSDKRLWAMCYYSREGKKDDGKIHVPADLTAHNFGLDIPINAYVKSVTVEMSLKVANPALEVRAPWLIFNIYGSNVTLNDGGWRKTGWTYGGNLYAVASDEVLSTSEKIISYTLPGEEWKAKKYPARSLNENIMGIDVLWEEPNRFDGTNIAVYINWVRIKVEYELPTTYLRWGSDMWDSDNPYELQLNHRYRIPLLYGNKSRASAGHDQYVDIQLPFGVHLDSYQITTKCPRQDQKCFVEIDEFKGKYRWYVDGGINAENFINLFVYTDTVGYKTFTATNMGKSVDGYAYVHGHKGEYSEAHISSGNVQKLTTSCFYFKTKVISNDDSIEYDITVDGEGDADLSSLSQAFIDYYNPDGYNNFLIGWNLSEDSIIQGVSIDEEHTTPDHIKFNIPANTDVEIEWTGCFMIITEGDNTLTLYDGDADKTYEYNYTAYDTDGVAAKLVMPDSIWYDHRILTQLELDGIVVPFAVKDTDRYMVEGDCTLKMHVQKQLAYIGCVPLKFSHHDPKSDFSNKTIKETYRNNVYTGKTGEIEETITCELHLPPQDWTTLQGLCELDRPVPVNAVPQAFEGDVLNHRGWVELGGVKNVQKTNPLWYKGELDFEYITHNINARFQIAKGVNVSQYTSGVLKNFLDYVCESGDEFADYTYTNVDGMIVHNRTGYFNVETDGTYIYNEDAEPNKRTLMTMDNGQTINIKTVTALSEAGKISFEWHSTKIPEDKENDIERIIRIVDKDGVILLEYKYFDYDFNTKNNVYSCRVNCSVLNKSIGAFDTVIDTILYLGNDMESLSLTQDINGNIVQEEEPTDIDMMPDTDRTYYDKATQETVELDIEPFFYNDFMYGSKLHFTLVGNVLDILDEGYTGKEVIRDSIQLEKGEYYYEVEFKNNNTDGDTNDILHFFDFEVQETILTTDLKQLYTDIVVSSFPIPDRTLLFTRNSEEGMLYYYKNEERPFTYIQEPFYMYWNGVDVKSSKGSSLFTLNNSYTIFYLQNGLVKLGFNRLNGEMYLYKYDYYSNSYIRVVNLQLTEYTDFSIGALSDDKIEIKVGKTVFIMYRGYPYVLIKHQNDDIEFKNAFNRIYAEGINGVNVEFPVMWDLVNSDNLLPDCVAGDDLKASCLDVELVYNDHVGAEPTLSLSKTSPSTVKNGDLVKFEVTGSVGAVDEEISVIGDYSGSFGKYSSATYDEYNRRVNVNTPYVTQEDYKLFVQMTTTIKNINHIDMDVYEKDNSTPVNIGYETDGDYDVKTLDDGSKLLTFIIDHSDHFSPGTILDKFVINVAGTNNLWDLNEHISVVVDGDESYVGKMNGNNPVYDENGKLVMMKYVEASKFCLIFKDNQPHTIQAIYKGNEEIGVAVSNVLMITPQQDSSTDENYVLTMEMPPEVKYLESPRCKWKLTHSGAPARNQVIERILPTAIWTGQTNNAGEVVGAGNGSNINPLYQWIPGKEYDVGGQFFLYPNGVKTLIAECWGKLKIVKNTPTIKHNHAEYKGDTTEFVLLDPQKQPIPNQRLIIEVGTQTYNKVTDALGKVYLRVNRLGNFKYKVTFGGNDYYNPVTFSSTDNIEE